jgi:hypothetical protein
MPPCDTVSVSEPEGVSRLEVTGVSATNVAVGEPIDVYVTVENIIEQDPGQDLTGDVLVEGAGDQVTTTVDVLAGEQTDQLVTLTANQPGEQEICAEVV